MTPMIDVVFQLLIYFLLTFSTADVLAHLDISRPTPEKVAHAPEPPSDAIRLEVGKAGFALNGRSLAPDDLGQLLRRLAAVDTNQMVLVVCDDRSRHASLVQALDLCAQCGLRNISVMSEGGEQ